MSKGIENTHVKYEDNIKVINRFNVTLKFNMQSGEKRRRINFQALNHMLPKSIISKPDGISTHSKSL